MLGAPNTVNRSGALLVLASLLASVLTLSVTTSTAKAGEGASRQDPSNTSCGWDVVGGFYEPIVDDDDYAYESYDCKFGEDNSPVARQNIVAPGRGTFMEHEDFVTDQAVDYYTKHGFNENFLYWEPIRNANLSGKTMAYCVDLLDEPDVGNPRKFCDGTKALGWSSIIWDDKLTEVKGDKESFIATVCGNFSPHTRPTIPPEITGRKFEDKNGNGTRQSDEPWLSGVKIKLYRAGVHLATETTNSDGRYTFTLNADPSTGGDIRYRAGTYEAVEVVPDDYRKTTPDPTVYVPWGSSGQPPFKMDDIGNQKVVDIQLLKSTPDEVTIAGEETTWQLDIKNNGPWSAPDVVVTDTVPAAYSAITYATSPCTFSGRSLRCEFNTLAKGATRRVTFRSLSRPDLAPGTIVNTGRVSTTMHEDNLANNVDSAQTRIITRADVSVVKSSDHTKYVAGDPFVFTLAVTNDGPSNAKSVTVTDAVPETFEPTSATVVSGPGTCDPIDVQQVTCQLQEMPPGATRTVEISGTVRGLAPGEGETRWDHDHQLFADKTETAWSLAPGAHARFDVACPSDRVLTDLSWTVTAVDHGTGLPNDVVATELIADDTQRGHLILENGASGQAQGALYGVCLTQGTSTVERHDHTLLPGDPVSSGPVTISTPLSATDPEDTLQTVTVTVPEHQFPTAPGFTVVNGSAVLYGSEWDGADAWTFTFEVPAGEDAVVDVRANTLFDATSTSSAPSLSVGGPYVPEHAHTLAIDHIVKTVTAPPGMSTHRLDCTIGYKGITATFLGAPWSIPMPITREWQVLNPAPTSREVVIDLLCLNMGPGDVIDPPEFENEATATSATIDPDPNDNTGTASGYIFQALGSTGEPALPPGSVVSSPAPVAQAGFSAPRRFQQHGRLVRGVVECETRCRATLQVKIRGHRDVTRHVQLRADRAKTLKVRLPKRWKATAVVVRAAGEKQRIGVRRH